MTVQDRELKLLVLLRRRARWSIDVKTMYEQDAKHKVRGKQKKEGVLDFAENASIHGINYVLERNVVAVSRYLVQCGYIGCNTGNGEKPSINQACWLAQLCLVAA